MIVREYIAKLSALPPDARIVNPAPEGGYKDPADFKQVTLRHEPDNPMAFGEYIEILDGDERTGSEFQAFAV